MKALDRLALLLIGLLAGSALTLLVIGVSLIGSDPAESGRVSTVGTVVAAVALAVAIGWTTTKRRDSHRRAP